MPRKPTVPAYRRHKASGQARDHPRQTYLPRTLRFAAKLLRGSLPSTCTPLTCRSKNRRGIRRPLDGDLRGDGQVFLQEDSIGARSSGVRYPTSIDYSIAAQVFDESINRCPPVGRTYFELPTGYFLGLPQCRDTAARHLRLMNGCFSVFASSLLHHRHDELPRHYGKEDVLPTEKGSCCSAVATLIQP